MKDNSAIMKGVVDMIHNTIWETRLHVCDIKIGNNIYDVILRLCEIRKYDGRMER